jgi:hypothetical protein
LVKGSIRDLADNTIGPRSKIHTAAEEALDNIGKVHKVPTDTLRRSRQLEKAAGENAKVPIRTYSGKKSEGAGFEVAGSDLAHGIRVNTASELTSYVNSITHELGHMLDISTSTASGKMSGTGRWSSKVAHEMHKGKDFETLAAKAELDMPSLRELSKMYAEVEKTATWKDLKQIPGKFGTYMRSPEEVWARAYAQWVGERSGSVRALRELEGELAERTAENVTRGTGRLVWERDEFEPIGRAIDAYMRAMGWME